ncbi:MAG: glycosyl hydrolase family 65 protein, partial [Eubacteriales bacterium]|nr:glycosyl hydrolase family 65 protein [Eubacteriales bacterium]
ASAVGHHGPDGFSMEPTQEGDRVSWAFSGELTQCKPVTLTKYCVFADSRRHPDPKGDAGRLLRLAMEKPFTHWAGLQKQALDALMANAKAGISGDEALDTSLAFSIYSLLMSAGRDGVGNIASKGLSGEGYEGHYFWDTEIYMFPFFLLTNPGIAKAVLTSRARMLPGAKAHAREMGHPHGALYAWRTITGIECSSYFPSGSAQYHINADIAHAFLSYWRVTDDLEYMADQGLEVLVETARLWMDAGHFLNGEFRIDDVTGPDEYSCIVNNNYYTNKAAQHHLRGVCQLAKALKARGKYQAAEKLGLTQGELDQFQKAADRMYLPFDKELGICAQDDSFLCKQRLDLSQIPQENFPLLMHYHPLFLYRHQVLKQADTVLSHFLFEEGETEEVMRDSYHYYEAITTHDSSLSPCVYSMMAARIGEKEKALKYYESVATLDLEDTHKNTADGIHAANMGGCWMGLVYGFAGLRIGENGLRFRPTLPENWEGYRFRFRWRESLAEAAMDKGGIRFTLLEGPSFTVSVNGAQVIVAQPLPV